MYHTVWKLTALAAVVGVGVAVVVHAQRGIQDSQDNEMAAASQPAPPDGPGEADEAVDSTPHDTAESSLPEQDEPELLASDRPRRTAIPASAKMSGDSYRGDSAANPKASRTGSFNDTEAPGKAISRARAAAGTDPFETPDDDAAQAAPARLQTAAPPATTRGAIDIVDVEDEADDAPREVREPVQAAATKNKLPSRARGPVLTLDDPDPEDTAKAIRNDDDVDVAGSGPRLLGATDGTAKEMPAAAAASETQPPAARVDPGDPFADDEPFESGNKPTRPAAKSDDNEAPLDDADDSPPLNRPPPQKIEEENEFPVRGRSDGLGKAADDGPQDDAADPAERGFDRTPEVVRPPAVQRGQPPAELSRTIEEGASGDDAAVPPKPELPQITIEKTAPATSILGRPMIYQIHVRNVGRNAAHEVVVEDVIPSDVTIDGSIPQALLKDNRLIWKLGTLAAGKEKKISVRVIPQSEGTIGGVATVNFAAEPKPNPVAGPQLKFDVAAPRQVAVGTPVEFNFRVRNTGLVPASGVTIRNVLPAGLRHPDGDDLEFEIGQLPAGNTREVKLVLTAAQAGPTVNRVVVTADGNIAEEAQVQLDVVGPSLVVTRDGPKRLFPNKTGIYSNTVTNPGLTQVSGVNIVETVPAGMEFVEAGEGGIYNAAKRSVTWTINQLGGTASKTVKVTLRSNARGAQVSVVRAYDSSGSSGEAVGATHVSGVCALSIEIGEIPPLIEAGETVKVAVRILNRGSDTAANVRAAIVVPAGMQLLDARGPTSHREAAAAENDGNERAARGAIDVQFAPIAKLEPRADAVIELTLKARKSGAARLEFQAQCDQLPDPIRREEVTTIVTPQ